MSNLIPIEEINALQVFTQDGIDALLQKIQEEVSDFEPNISSAKGRNEIKSIAYKVTLSKGVIDRAGADLVKGWKEKAKIVDDSRRKAREFLDALSAEVRAPLTQYEEETARMKAEADHKKMICEAHDAALIDHDIWFREKVLAEKEARIQAEEEERQRIELARINAEEEEKHQAEIKNQAEIKAKKDAAEKIKVARLRAQKAEADKKLAVEKADREKREAAEKAERDKKAAVEAERQRVTLKQEERDRISRDQAEGIRKAEEARKANADHRREINRVALQALICLDAVLDDAAGKEIIIAIYQEKIPGIRMDY